MIDAFRPYQDLARFLMSAFDANGTDGAHDFTHLLRVWRNAAGIARTEPDVDMEVLLAAALLHDCVPVEKSSPDRPMASRLSAARAREIVAPLGWTPARVAAMAHAVAAHSFSGAVAPRTREARILRDADRLDAIGAIGIARCFHVGGRMGGALYHPTDPGAEAREPDDRSYALDHFSIKLFGLVSGFLTPEGRRMAAARAELMHDFVAAFRAEVAWGGAEDPAA
jgi:uncharacterized protein